LFQFYYERRVITFGVIVVPNIVNTYLIIVCYGN